MKRLKESAKARSADWQPPVMFSLNEPKERRAVEQLLESGKVVAVIDQIERAQEELYHIKYPQQIDSVDRQTFSEYVAALSGNTPDEYGTWVFFPWNRHLVHFPPKQHLRALRTSRNRNLIRVDEQLKLFDKRILIIGLSVGSNAAEALLTQGIGGSYILVDTDVLDPTNLNRIHASYEQLGEHKVDIVAKHISELDPYIEQLHYRKGLTTSNITAILEQHRPDVIIDEMDHLEMKIILRHEAQVRRIPLIMATDDGDDVLLDIERYDEQEGLPILHGRLPEALVEEILGGKLLSRSEAGRVIGQYFVGFEYVPLRMLESLAEVGKTLPSWPQLGGAATLAGVLLAYATKKILLKESIRSGRLLIGPDAALNPQLETAQYKAHIQAAQRKLLS